MSRLARDHRVLFCSRAQSWEEVVHTLKTGNGLRWRSRRITPRLIDLPARPWLPRVPQRKDLDQFLLKLQTARIRAALRRRKWDNPILYIWHPDLADMVDRLDARLVCFHCVDDYLGYTHLTDQTRRVMSDQIRYLLDRADLVFAAGNAMRAGLDRADVQVVPNGVDYALFATAHDKAGPRPTDMAHIPRPIVAHIGRLNVKIDYRLLNEIARRRRNWSVLLVGPFLGPFRPEEQRAIDELLAQPNAYHIPAKPVDQLPAYLRHVDVALMAYRMMGWVVRGFPLKLFEYLAAGKPCVGAPLEENIRYGEYVTIANTADEWVAAIEHWLANDSEVLALKRMALAQANSWDDRCASILRLIGERLGGTAP
ncbi:MAG: glycosyltransferase [Verrucomicrobia bacterium]|nr:glycosyltransferase [Verrucomicrobiota bacterium]